ncbi:MAG: amidohydrolase family protein [Chloroflexota bacterium]|nr:amidohydrolase family protein [Chloroflexota bacterium]
MGQGHAEHGLYIRAGRLITGEGSDVIEDAAVHVSGGRIVAAGRAQDVAPAAGATAVDYPQGTVLPGLIDAHVHLTFRRGETSVEHAQLVSDAMALLRGVQAARRVLAAGVTTVRDCGARGRVAQDLRDGVRSGLIAGPRILASGPPVTTTSGHLWALGYEADTGAAACQAVRRLVKEGADFIKVCATGGGMTPGSMIGRAQYSVEDLRAVAEDAHRLGRHVAAHAHGTEGLARAVAAGIDTIEHCSWLDAAGTGQAFNEDVAREMAARGTFANVASGAPRPLVERDAPLVQGGNGEHQDVDGTDAPASTHDIASHPTSSPAQAIARWEHARRAKELGVAVLFSTDAIYGVWDDGHDLSYLAQVLVEAAGFSNLDVLQMITAVPARAIGWGDRLGTVAPGKLADLVVVDGNPARDIRALQRVLAVYQEGRQLSG